MVGIGNVVDERLHGNKYNVHHHPHCSYMDITLQRSDYLLKDTNGWPGNRTRPLNVGPVLFSPNPCFSEYRALKDGTWGAWVA